MITSNSNADDSTDAMVVDDEKKERTDNASDVSAHVSLSLAGKWAPSEGSHFDKSNRLAKRLAKLLYGDSNGHSLVPYRRLLTRLRTHLAVVERLMCANDWDQINFASVPSKAHLKLKKAFSAHQAERYAEYLASVKSGKSEIKSTGLHPHELTKHYRNNGEVDETVESQWADLIEKMRTAGGLTSAVALVDVSGSMSSGQGNVAPIDVAIALGPRRRSARTAAVE